MIYLDHNATVFPDPEILREALDFSLQYPANSSGLSFASQQTNRAIEECRSLSAEALNLEPRQIIFTASASEANHIFITSLWLASLRENKPFRPLFSRLEHPSVTELIKRLPHCEPLEYTVTRTGQLAQPEQVSEQIKSASCAVMMASHNESGLLLPLDQMQRLIGELEIPLLCDFSQAAGKAAPRSPVTPEYIRQHSNGLTYFSLAGHKLGAGHGAGLLIRPELPQGKLFEEKTLTAGGSQEFSIRAGTHNTMAIRALASALQKKRQNPVDYDKLLQVTERFEFELKKRLRNIVEIKIVGDQGSRLAGTTLAMFGEAQIDFLIMALDRAGITVSTGTSCKSRSRTPSPGLLSMGFSEQQALSVIRFSYDESFDDSAQDRVLDELVKILPAVL